MRQIGNWLRSRRWGLRSSQLKEGVYPHHINGEDLNLAHSVFNPSWPEELGVDVSVILDLGSFDGGDALRFREAFPNARIVTVEADPDRHAITKANISGTDVELINSAVCRVDGPINWHSATVNGEVGAQGSLFAHTDRYRTKFPYVDQTAENSTVQGSRLDTLCQTLALEQIDVLHMDIEGAEYEALDSMGNIRPRIVFLEMRKGLFHGSATPKQTDALLRRLGYKMLLHLGTDRLYVLPSKIIDV